MAWHSGEDAAGSVPVHRSERRGWSKTFVVLRSPTPGLLSVIVIFVTRQTPLLKSSNGWSAGAGMAGIIALVCMTVCTGGCKETQTAVVWSCLPFIRSGQNHLARHSERGEEDKADRGRGGKTTSGNGQAWSSAGPRGQWRTGKMEKTGREIICAAPSILAVKG